MSNLPLFINWGIWLAINGIIFLDKALCVEHLVGQVFSIYELILEEEESSRPCVIREEVTDRSFPWACFDISSYRDSCDAGAFNPRKIIVFL